MRSLIVGLTQHGPLLSVSVSVSAPKQTALQKANAQIPVPITCQLLVDTGASNTCIDTQILDALGLTPTGSVTAHTPSTTAASAHQASVYDVGVTLLHQNSNLAFGALPVCGGQFKHHGIDGLFGRDLLKHCQLVYNGELGLFTISF